MAFLLSAFLSTTIFAAEKDLSDFESTNGFCTMDLIRLVEKPVKKANFNHPENSFLKAAKIRAIDFYKAYVGGEFVKEGYELEVKQSLYFSGSPSNRQISGALIEVTNGGDESLLKFYFRRNENGAARLLLGIHDEQSATSFWTCE